MKTLIRGATLLTMTGDEGDRPVTGDLLVEDERIAAIASRLPAAEGVQKRGPVLRLDCVGVRAGALRGVLAR